MGVAPVVVCRKSGANTVIENSAAVPRNSAALTSPTVRVRNRCSGTIGSAARRSRRTSAADATMVAATSPSVGAEFHAYRLPPQTQARISVLVAMARSAAPAASRGRAGRSTAGAGSRRSRPTSAMAPIGRLTRNTQRQLAASTSTPPSSGPMMVATAKVAAM